MFVADLSSLNLVSSRAHRICFYCCMGRNSMSGSCVLFTWGLENWKQASKHGGQICILCSRWWRSERWAAVDRGVTTGYARTMAGSIGRQSTLWGLRKAGRHFGFCNPGRGTRYGGAVCCMDQGV